MAASQILRAVTGSGMPAIETTRPPRLSTKKAMAYLETGRAKGKVVLVMS